MTVPLKLFVVANERLLRPRWALEELGIEYEVLRVEQRGGKGEFAGLGLHPYQTIPALLDGTRTVLEAAAICMHLADKYAERGLIPAEATAERTAYYGLMRFAVGSLESLVEPVVQRALRMASRAREETASAREQERMVERTEELRERLAGRSYLLPQFSMADVVVGGLLHPAAEVGLLRSSPELLEYLRGLRERPAFQKAIEPVAAIVPGTPPERESSR